MKKSSFSKKKNSTLSILTVGILVIAIIVILLLTNNNLNSSLQENEEILEQKETEENNISKENQSTEEPKENTDSPNTDATDNEQVEEPIKEDENENKEEPKNKQENENKEEPNSTVGEEKQEDNGYLPNQVLPANPTYIEGVLIANKKYPLPKNFNPGEDVEARASFEEMAAAAQKAGYELTAFSTFRSFDYQSSLYNRYVERDGKNNADRYSARPGYSEHQTGLAFDIGEVNREDVWLTSKFGETEAGKWLVENAHNYGFILRYPQGKEHITGYMYESWHFRYLGIPLATEVKLSGLTLEEFLGLN